MRLFGTDGIRAPFGEYPLDRSTVAQLGTRLGELLSRKSAAPVVVIGGDTRDSTDEISLWLAAGLEAAGTRVLYGGVLPTPAVAKAVLDHQAAAGISVSASHNLHPYNGIKLFDSEGFKWSPEAEAQLESMIVDATVPELPDRPPLIPDPGIAEGYLQHLLDQVGGGTPFAGLTIVVDTANGAATPFAESLFTRLGAQVFAIGDRPDGRNINAGCGSTAPESMLIEIERCAAHIGVAFDGDADRALIADERATMHDGDAMMFAWARHLRSLENLEPPQIVATSMSNLGLEKALRALDIEVVRCDVGDRTVVATMRDRAIRLGGEQSGHLVDLGASTTGDGLATALQMISILHQTAMPLSELLADFQRFPQVLVNVEVESKPAFDTLPEVARVAAEVEEALGSDGRLVLRYSGTEPLARVMIEGPEMAQIEELANRLIDVIRDAVGAPTA